jgi:tetratricopeptide (TPR) repeat protein
MEYRDGIKEILDGDPKQLTMVSSYLVALETTGRCYLYLKRYDEALDHFDIELKVLRKYMQNAPQSILNSWIEMLYNSKYYIARCYMESGYKELGIKWANGLYHELLDAGCPDDSDFEPMENVRELLGLI